MLSIKVQDLLIGKNIYLYHYTCSSFKTCLKRNILIVSLHKKFDFSLTCLRRNIYLYHYRMYSASQHV